MRKKRRPRAGDEQGDLFKITPRLRTAPCVPALREAVSSWRRNNYPGATRTTRKLLKFWFESDHRLSNGSIFAYHQAQRDALETLVYVWECQEVLSQSTLVQRFGQGYDTPVSPDEDSFLRLGLKMATGSGKTKVLALTIAWQLLNAILEPEEVSNRYATTFLLLAPNIIVYERLSVDFRNGRIFREDPIIPKEMLTHWRLNSVLRGERIKTHAAGNLFLTNVQQLYGAEVNPRKGRKSPNAVTALLGPKALKASESRVDLPHEIASCKGRLLVANDEAHHTHDPDSAWNAAVRKLSSSTPICFQLDISATPRFPDGTLFPWIVFDYPLKQAILDGVVKRPMRGITDFKERSFGKASQRYEGFLVAGVERWKEYVQQLAPTGKMPLLFIMLSSTADAENVAEWLNTRYPAELGGERTLVIHTDAKGQVSKRDLDSARALARNVDQGESPVRAIVSVLMLREGWDVQNVTVVVGLRPFSATANILPEQAIGRGLRLMYRGQRKSEFQERVDIIGNERFLEFVDDLEKLEELSIEKFQLSKAQLKVTTVRPRTARHDFDIGIPQLTPTLARSSSISADISGLDVGTLKHKKVAVPISLAAAQTIDYRGYDVLTNREELERTYTLPDPRTSQEIIGYYTRRVAEDLKLPTQFAQLAPKVSEFLSYHFFESPVDLDTQEILASLGTAQALSLTIHAFRSGLGKIIVAERVSRLAARELRLSESLPFPWSHRVYEAAHSVFNGIPCMGEDEERFARILDSSPDVERFAKLVHSMNFSIDYTDGQGSFRVFQPGWIVVSGKRTFLLETNSEANGVAADKDRAALLWCKNATRLTGQDWSYRRLDLLSLVSTPGTSFVSNVCDKHQLSLRMLDVRSQIQSLRAQLYEPQLSVVSAAGEALALFKQLNDANSERWLTRELNGYSGDEIPLHKSLGRAVDDPLVALVAGYRCHTGTSAVGQSVRSHFFVESLAQIEEASRAVELESPRVSIHLEFADGSPEADFSSDVFERVLVGFLAALHFLLDQVEE